MKVKKKKNKPKMLSVYTDLMPLRFRRCDPWRELWESPCTARSLGVSVATPLFLMMALLSPARISIGNESFPMQRIGPALTALEWKRHGEIRQPVNPFM